MRGTRGDAFYLKAMLQALESLAGYSSVGRQAFMGDTMRQDATICRLAVLGEAAKHISDELRKKNTDVPWRYMTGLRDILVHDYFGVDLDMLWGILEIDLPPLRTQLASIYESIQAEG